MSPVCFFFFLFLHCLITWQLEKRQLHLSILLFSCIDKEIDKVWFYLEILNLNIEQQIKVSFAFGSLYQIYIDCGFLCFKPLELRGPYDIANLYPFWKTGVGQRSVQFYYLIKLSISIHLL